MRISRAFVLAVLAGLLIPRPAHALVEHAVPQDPRWVEPARALVASTHLDASALASESASAARTFLGSNRGSWEFFVDARTGLATLVQGEGIPLIPGRGNSLGTEEARRQAAKLEDVEPLVAAFLLQNRALLGPPVGRLVLDRDTSGALDDGRLFNMNYRWLLGDVPVEGAGVFVRINAGNIVQFGSALVGSTVLDPVAALDDEDAQRRLLAYAKDAELARIVRGPELLVQPEDGPAGVAYRLVWVLRYKVVGRIETFEGRVDAHTGEVVGFRDVNAYAGRVTGGIFPRTVSDPETRVPFPSAQVLTPGVVGTDTAGAFGYTGGTAQSGLDGVYFDTICDTCSNPVQPAVTTSIGIGRLDFGLGGVDAVGNGLSSRADRNAFYHLNQVRRLGKKWLPSLAWFDAPLDAYVNIIDTCNAYYDGPSVNFFRSGGGCNNTGEISDVMQHEWGHGLDDHTRLADGATGEATADVVAMHMTHDALVGPYFGVNGSPVRDLDKARSGLLSRGNVASFCPAGGGALGFEVHCEGEIYGQTSWDLAQALVAKHGLHTGWRTSERIFFPSLPNAGSYLPEGTFPIYAAYLAADDDDGNLANGTPNGGEIYQAFSTHGIAGTLATSSPTCARPAQPVVTATPACDRMLLSWPAVAGASSYQVLRAEVRSNTAYFPVATLSSSQTTYEDAEVAPATDYYYVVLATNAAGCESTVENPAYAKLTAQPILSATSATVDDTPRGNRSGFADPGEEVDLHVTLANYGEVGAASVAGTLVAVTPGVTVLNATDSFQAVAVGGAGSNTGILRFVTDAGQVSCGQMLRFRLVPSEGTGCASANSYFDVMLGQMQGGQPVCDPTPACYVAPSFAGLQSASSGSSCGENVLAWQGGTTSCVNATITYNVYRSTDPSFVPAPQNRVATGVAGTAFTDTLLAPGGTYSYVVRAFDSRSGEESNVAHRVATAPTSPDVRAPVFAGLASISSGSACGETTLSWPAALETCSNPISYNVYRSTDPAFVPSAANRVATTTSPAYTDAALVPGTTYYYVVRALDALGNEDGNLVRSQAAAKALDRLITRETFEATNGGFTLIDPNTATSGLWEWGDPQGTEFQPESCPPPGTKCWVTGLAAAGGGGGNDVDGGLTTLRTPRYDLTTTVAPYIRFGLWFTNDRGGAPGEDPFWVHVSSNDGTSWVNFYTVSGGTPLAWVDVEKNITIARTANMRFRFQARDLNSGSLVEAAFDNFEIWDRGQGCIGCTQPVPKVTKIVLSKSGQDVVLDWSADPVQATRFAVYALSGPGLTNAVRIGTTATRSFVHAGAASAPGNFYYAVAAIDSCGGESALH